MPDPNAVPLGAHGSEVVDRCPLCGSRHSFPLADKVASRDKLEYECCRGCGLVYQSPRPTVPALRDFYARGYRTTQQGAEDPTEEKLEFERRRAEHQLGLLEGRVGKVTHFLEIGCAAARLSLAARERYGCSAVGIEPGRAYLDWLKKAGLETYARLGDLVVANPARRFDVIAMSHVLEHMSDPVAYLRRVRALLAPAGVVLLEVPNVWAHTAFEPGHLFAFSSRTLAMTMRAGGFQVVFQSLHSKPRWRDPRKHYLTVIARGARSPDVSAPAPEGMSEGWFRFRRAVQRAGLDHPVWYLALQARRAARQAAGWFVRTDASKTRGSRV